MGYDIAAGWYQGTVNDHMGYWEVSSDANGQTLVANDYAMDAVHGEGEERAVHHAAGRDHNAVS